MNPVKFLNEFFINETHFTPKLLLIEFFGTAVFAYGICSSNDQ
jgi:hypothetical protein